MTRPLPIIGLAAAFATGPAFAQAADAVAGNLRTFCSGDYLRLCAGMDTKGPEVVACFRKNMAQVSPGCRTAIAQYQAQSPKGSALGR